MWKVGSCGERSVLGVGTQTLWFLVLGRDGRSLYQPDGATSVVGWSSCCNAALRCSLVVLFLVVSGCVFLRFARKGFSHEERRDQGSGQYAHDHRGLVQDIWFVLKWQV